jgi:predicted O-methyltransferase YrrM
MEFIDVNIQDYAEKYTTPESELLKSLNRETWANVLIPRMLSGHLQGRILAMFSKLMAPKCILEIGTYTGYSALCLAEGLAEDGELHTIDINEELNPTISKYFDQSGFGSKLKFHSGNALDIIPTLAGPFDLVFIDADKENYSIYFDLVIDRMPSGGLIIADNVLWSGKVLDAAALASDEETRALSLFTKKVHEDERVENLLLPVRDGLMLLRKK